MATNPVEKHCDVSKVKDGVAGNRKRGRRAFRPRRYWRGRVGARLLPVLPFIAHFQSFTLDLLEFHVQPS